MKYEILNWRGSLRTSGTLHIRVSLSSLAWCPNLEFLPYSSHKLLPFAGVGTIIRLTAWVWGWYGWGDWESNFSPDYQLILPSSGLHFLQCLVSATIILSLALWWVPLEALRFELLQSAKSLPSFHPLTMFRVRENWIHGIWACIFISCSFCYLGLTCGRRRQKIWLFHHLETRSFSPLFPFGRRQGI